MSNGYLVAAAADVSAARDIADGFGLDVIDASAIDDIDAAIAALSEAANVGLVLSNAAAADPAYVALLQTLGERLLRAQLIVVDAEARAAFASLPTLWPTMSLDEARARSSELVRQRAPQAPAEEPTHAHPLPGGGAEAPVETAPPEPEREEQAPAPEPTPVEAEQPETPAPEAEQPEAPASEEEHLGAPPLEDADDAPQDDLSITTEKSAEPPQDSGGAADEPAAPEPFGAGNDGTHQDQDAAPSEQPTTADEPPIESPAPPIRERPSAAAEPREPPPIAPPASIPAPAPQSAPVPQAPPARTRAAAAPSAPADATAFAPKKLRRGTPELVRIVIHQPKDLQDVIKAARKIDPRTEPAPSGMPIGDVALGATIGVALEVRGATTDGALQRRTWAGEPIDFSFSVDADGGVKQVVLLARVFINDAQIGVLAFTRNVSGPAKKPHSTGDRVRLKRHKRVFLSYSSRDRETVSAIATAYQMAGVDHFWDRASLKSGEEWHPRLRREIDRADLFHLCWSRAASDSEWVRKETEHALTRRKKNSGKPDITVQMLDGPPWAPHPPELDSINFDDFVRAAIVGYARGDGSN